MKSLSPLQKHILSVCLKKGGRVERELFCGFYDFQKKKPKVCFQEKIISQSLERLINRRLLVGFGKRTAFKWFLTHAKLTQKGKVIAHEFVYGKQYSLPLK
jgi:hypothetical protein